MFTNVFTSLYFGESPARTTLWLQAMHSTISETKNSFKYYSFIYYYMFPYISFIQEIKGNKVIAVSLSNIKSVLFHFFNRTKITYHRS